MAGLHEAMDAVGGERTRRDGPPEKHYIPFSHDEWLVMEAQAGRKLSPSGLKALLKGIFAGKVTMNVAKPEKVEAKAS
jgi:hypothetical protein